MKNWSRNLRNVNLSSKNPIDKKCLKDKRKVSKGSRNSGNQEYFSSKSKDKKTLKNWKKRSQQKQSILKSSLKARMTFQTVGPD